MRNTVDERAIILGEYIIENDATVRAAAKQFKISKSTVHTAVTKRNGLCGWQHRQYENGKTSKRSETLWVFANFS